MAAVMRSGEGGNREDKGRQEKEEKHVEEKKRD